MSKERDLLVRVLGSRTFMQGVALRREIEELLAQPEQQEQEPIGIVVTIGGYPDDSEHTVKLTCRHRDLKHGDLLYTSPPKREPLSDEEINAIDLPEKQCTMRELVKLIEKAHGITDDIDTYRAKVGLDE